MSRKCARFSFGSRAATIFLAALLLGGNPPATGQVTFRFKLNGDGASSRMSRHLAQAMGEVKGRFERGRAALPLVGDGGTYPRAAVLGLVDATERDLEQAIEHLHESELAALSAWVVEAFQHIRAPLAAPSGPRTAAAFPGLPGRPVFAVASGLKPWRGIERAKSDPPAPGTIGAAQSSQIMDQVEKVISRLFFLADRDDLEVKFWVGTTPAERATFRFWPLRSGKGAPPSPTIIKTDGSREHITRGLYSYSVALGAGPVTQLLASDQPGSEQLDLVNGSSFFCCRFEEDYCHHVDDPKECQADRR